MDYTLQFIGIYPDSIKYAVESCEDAMKELGFTDSEICDMNDQALDCLREVGSFDDITNSIIYAYYSTAKDIIQERYPCADVHYYVNCSDSPFTVDMPEVEDIREDWETALKSIPYFEIAKRIGWGFTDADLRELARLHKADIQREAIEDLLTDCNFHSECAAFSDGDYSILNDSEEG